MRLCLTVFLAVVTGSYAFGFPAYYNIADHAQAQLEARQRGLPLAWLGGRAEELTEPNPPRGSEADLLQMALATLQDSAVVVFFDGINMAPVPAIVHGQFHFNDDGPLPGGAAWLVPKIVFTNPEVTKTLGRVSATQMRAARDAAIYPVLQSIRDNPTTMLVPPPAPPQAASAPVADTGNDTGADEADTPIGKIPVDPALGRFLNENRDSLKWVAIGLAVLLVFMMLVRRRS